MTKHAIAVLSGRPPVRGFRSIEASPQTAPKRRASADHTGSVTIEAYTVPYAQDGSPQAAIVAGLAADGTRALAQTADQDLLKELLSDDPLGHQGWSRTDNLSKSIDLGILTP